MPPPIPPPGIIGALFFSGKSVITTSVVKSIAAAETAFWIAERVTLVGSIIPASNKSSYIFLAALNPYPPDFFLTSSTTTAPSKPAFSAICLKGSSKALLKVFNPILASPLTLTSSKALITRIKATPPPGTIPSATAAKVADLASSILACLYFCSASVAAPFPTGQT